MIKGDIVSVEQCAIRKDYIANKKGLMSNFFFKGRIKNWVMS